MNPDELAKDDNDILDECRRRLKLAIDAESSNRSEALTDLQFCNGEQWPTDIKRDRDTDARPCLTINITDAMVRRVTNALRENRPRIKFHPVGNGADIQTAKVRNGLTRHIEASSGADYAYDCGVESAVRGGWGYWRVGSKYVTDQSFDQDLTIEAIPNPLTVYKDSASRMPDGSDMMWCIESEWIRRDEHRQKYGEGSPYSRLKQITSAAFNFLGAGDDISDWSKKEELRIASYWRVATKEATLTLYSDGRMQFDKIPASTLGAAGLTVIKTRKVMRRSVEWYLVSGDRILDRRDWPGKWIPIVPCYGRSLDLNGKVTLKGMVRDLRDPARMYNYAQTAKTEVYALMPKAPWMGAAGFMEGHEAAWRDANRKPIVALEYKPIRLEDGSYAPPPERQAPPQPNAGFAEWGDSTRSDFLAVAGMPNDPGQDAKGEVVSGVAIKRREGISDISHFDFYDNQTRSMRHTGNILNDLFPYFYDTERTIRIIGDDGTPETTQINEKKAADKVLNDMVSGLYDCVVDTGPNYQTKREESADAMLTLLGTPLGEMVAAGAGDVVVRSLDFDQADLIADRIAVNIPGAQIDKDSDIPEKAQIMIKGLQSQLAQANQKSMALELELKAGVHKVELQQKGEDGRAHLAAQTKIHDTNTRADVELKKAHIQAITHHDVAEIHGVTQLLNTHTEAAHNKEAAKELEKSASAAEKRDE